MNTVKSDLSLLAELRQFGRFDTNACLQCGSCTLSCSLTNDLATFPRRTIRLALLGLREPLDSSLDPWLCHYCGDCSTTCPRESEPGEGLMTLRRYLAARYDLTGLASKIFRSKVWEIGALFVVGTIVLVLAVFYHLYVLEMPISDLTDADFAGSVGLEHMFGMITVFTRVVILLPLLFLLFGAARMYWLTMHRDVEHKIPLHLYLTEIKVLIVHALTQRRWRDCTDQRRWYIHLLLVVGCGLMLVLLLFGLDWFQTDEIYPLYHPQRWLGYLATVAIVAAVVEILIGRMRKRRQMHRFSDSTDWIFPIMLLLTALTGIAIHILRYLELASAAHYTYAAHLVIAVPLLVVEIPFGKWSHMIYRPLAIYFHRVKEKAMQQELAREVVLSHAS